jgi:hypothetical protein
MLKLTTICDTYFKLLPRQAESLVDNQKLFIQANSEFVIQNYTEEEEHFRIILEKPIRGKVEWFVLINDSKITDFFRIACSTSSAPQQRFRVRLNLEGVRKYFRFLDDRLGAKPIKIKVGSAGQKIKIDISNRQELDAAIKAAQDFVNEGKTLFDAPDQMKIGIPVRVSLRITKKLTYDFFEDLIHIHEVEVENIRVSQFMAASLRGDDFKIEALGNEEQIIEDNDFTQWHWKVVPLKSGNRKLWASVTIKVKVENEQAFKTVRVYDKEINVKINPVYLTRNFVVQYWQWLIASAIIPIVGLLLKK